MSCAAESVLAEWCTLPTALGDFRMYDSGRETVRLVCIGDPRRQGEWPLLRLHSSCMASEVFGARDCDCADQLRDAMAQIASERRGLIIHLPQEGRGHGLATKIRAVGAMQRRNLDTFDAFVALGLQQDSRDYGEAIGTLRELGIRAVRLLTNNPHKVDSLTDAGIGVTMVNMHPSVRTECRDYLATKNAKLGHRIPLSGDRESPVEPIRFYHSDRPWGWLSNLSGHAVYRRDRVWPSVEHYYQAQKFAGTPTEEAIRTAATPLLAKRRAAELSSERWRGDWETVKERVMLGGLRAKFRQHPDLRHRLLDTGDRVLVEHTTADAYWGDGGDGSGRNRLGALLMRVRCELQSTDRLALPREPGQGG